MNFEKVFNNFCIEGKLIKVKANKEGHINSTYISTVENNGKIEKYTHQKINKFVFQKPRQVMSNIERVTSHIQEKVKNEDNAERRCLNVVKTKDGNILYYDEEKDEYWRTYKYIDNVKTFLKVNTINQAYLLGKAVGNFQKQLSDFNGDTLYETIVDFHNMQVRYDQLESAIKDDKYKRVAFVEKEIQFLLDNKQRSLRIHNFYKEGSLKISVTHNDTKINNILFSNDEKEALCVIDLDTVMPGTILYDVGDMIRTATSTALEDEVDYTKMKCNVDFFKNLIEGYLEVAQSFISDLERKLIVEAGRYITGIMAVRFLTDYLNGDVYYSTSREHHNLDRVRTQIALIKDMDLKWEQLSSFLN